MIYLHSAHCILFMKQPVLFMWSWDFKLLFQLSFSGKLGEKRRLLRDPPLEPWLLGILWGWAESYGLLKMSIHWDSPRRVSLLRPTVFFSVPPEWCLRMGPRSPCSPQVFRNRCWSPQCPAWLFLLPCGLAACAQTPSCQREGCFARLVWPKSWEAADVPEEVSGAGMELDTWCLGNPLTPFLPGLINMSWEIYWVCIFKNHNLKS